MFIVRAYLIYGMEYLIYWLIATFYCEQSEKVTVINLLIILMVAMLNCDFVVRWQYFQLFSFLQKFEGFGGGGVEEGEGVFSILHFP